MQIQKPYAFIKNGTDNTRANYLQRAEEKAIKAEELALPFSALMIDMERMNTAIRNCSSVIAQVYISIVRHESHQADGHAENVSKPYEHLPEFKVKPNMFLPAAIAAIDSGSAQPIEWTKHFDFIRGAGYPEAWEKVPLRSARVPKRRGLTANETSQEFTIQRREERKRFKQERAKKEQEAVEEKLEEERRSRANSTVEPTSRAKYEGVSGSADGLADSIQNLILQEPEVPSTPRPIAVQTSALEEQDKYFAGISTIAW